MVSNQGSFNLTKQFSLLSFLCILIIGVSATYTLSLFFTSKMVTREATISKDFIDSIIAAEGTWDLFIDERLDGIENSTLKTFFTHVANMPDVVRANIYGSDRSILWSSAPELIGDHFLENDELDRALLGDLVFESGIIGETTKEEHKFFGRNILGVRYIETYIPIWNKDRNAVVGVAELYKVPRALHHSIVEGQQLIGVSALVGGILLYLSLFWIIKRASRVMDNQQQQIIENKSLSTIGETASAIAHSMRNPLASIRACAELTLTDDLEGARESALDIIGEADRLDRWTRELLLFSASNTEGTDTIDINEIVDTVLQEYRNTLKNSSTLLRLNLHETALPVQVHVTPLSQVLGNLILNAVEAMGENGELVITTAPASNGDEITICVEDNGPGIPEEFKEKLFKPFATTKTGGSGIGLALSRHLVEHYGGSLDLKNMPGKGVSAIVSLPSSKEKK